MKNLRSIARPGFTIVELLIVISVIGILASVTVVAFNGVSNRAYDAKRIAAVDGYEKIFQLYLLQNTTLPLTPEYAAVCLGGIEHYPAANGFEEGECVYEVDGGVRTSVATIDESFNNRLRTVADVPDASHPVIRVGGTKVRGMFYSATVSSTVSGVSVDTGAVLQYYGLGDRPCGRGVKVQTEIEDGSAATICVTHVGDSRP